MLLQEELSFESTLGSFQGTRENDMLSVALGNKEHPGRTRGLGLYVPWKHGFQDESGMYRRRKRNKAERDAQLREEIKESLRDELRDELMGELAGVIRDEVRKQTESQQVPTAAPVASPQHRPSSCASNPTQTHSKFPVDDILVIIITSRMLAQLVGLFE